MVDMMGLSTWLVEGSLNQRGFVCSKCGTREAVLYTNASVDEAVRKLTRYPPGHRKFQFLFAKLVRKVEAVQDRGEVHGSIKRPDMASS